jgi:hypothetical protein
MALACDLSDSIEKVHSLKILGFYAPMAGSPPTLAVLLTVPDYTNEKYSRHPRSF